MSTPYDRIARFYDVDMARNMPFDDVGFYARLCARAGGRVLELGCGNGRILLALVRRGIDVIGVDASQGMLDELRRKALAEGIPVPAVRMDIRALALAPGFSVILCPYSLVTYMAGPHDAARLVAACATLLAPGGMLVVDAFVPRPVKAGSEFTQDYERPLGDATLVRSKRIAPQGDGTNRIERRYRVVAADGRIVEEVDVAETIRPLAPAACRALVEAARLQPMEEWWDYGARATSDGAQFYTLSARRSAND